MLIVINKRSGVPIFKQIMDQVEQQILTNQLKDGDPVTSVKDLSSDLQINPMTVSKAYSLLEAAGFLERRRGVGLFVQKPKHELTKRTKMDVLEEALRHPTAQAVQMGIEESDLWHLVLKIYRQYSALRS